MNIQDRLDEIARSQKHTEDLKRVFMSDLTQILGGIGIGIASRGPDTLAAAAAEVLAASKASVAAKQHRGYRVIPKSTKRKALKLIKAGIPASKIAAELGIDISTVYTWKRVAKNG